VGIKYATIRYGGIFLIFAYIFWREILLYVIAKSPSKKLAVSRIKFKKKLLASEIESGALWF